MELVDIMSSNELAMYYKSAKGILYGKRSGDLKKIDNEHPGKAMMVAIILLGKGLFNTLEKEGLITEQERKEFHFRLLQSHP